MAFTVLLVVLLLVLLVLVVLLMMLVMVHWTGDGHDTYPLLLRLQSSRWSSDMLSLPSDTV